MEAEEFEDMERLREVANRASGWNGSLELWAPSTHVGNPCPAPVRSKLLELRAAAEARAEQQRKRGLCL
jgi:hypothetical protein